MKSEFHPVTIWAVPLTFCDPTDVEVIGRVGWVDDVGRTTNVEFQYLIGCIIFNPADPVGLTHVWSFVIMLLYWLYSSFAVATGN